LAFKLDTTAYGQLTYVRMYQGIFKRGDPIYNTRTGQKVRIAKMCKMHADKMEPCETVQAGDIAAFFGVDCASGDTFINQRAMSAGLKKVAMESIYVPDPVVKLSIEPKKKSSKDLETFNKALTRFGKEDPTFVVEFNADTGEKTISGMGELHLEIYAQRMEREYDCPVTLGRPTVVFYETLLDEAQFNYLHKKQTGGRGQYGQAEGFVKPTFDADEGGMKVSFTDATAGNELSKNYVGPIEKGMRSMLESGPTAGKPVIGFHMELEAGKQHENDSSDFAFFNCGVGCMEQIFSKVPTKVLGPVMKVEVAIPNQFQNQVVHMISGRHGQINEQEETYDYTTYDCRVQLYDMFGFTADLRQCTEGKGEFTMEFEKYDFARDEIENTLQNEFEQAKIDAANLAKKPQSSKKKK